MAGRSTTQARPGVERTASSALSAYSAASVHGASLPPSALALAVLAYTCAVLTCTKRLTCAALAARASRRAPSDALAWNASGRVRSISAAQLTTKSHAPPPRDSSKILSTLSSSDTSTCTASTASWSSAALWSALKNAMNLARLSATRISDARLLSSKYLTRLRPMKPMPPAISHLGFVLAGSRGRRPASRGRKK